MYTASKVLLVILFTIAGPSPSSQCYSKDYGFFRMLHASIKYFNFQKAVLKIPLPALKVPFVPLYKTPSLLLEIPFPTSSKLPSLLLKTPIPAPQNTYLCSSKLLCLLLKIPPPTF